MKIAPFWKKHKKKLMISFSVLVFLLLFIILALPLIIRPIAERQLTKALDREVTIDKIKLNPIKLSVQIDTVTIKEKKSKDNFVSFDRLYVNFQLISVLKRGLIVKDLVLDNPYICVTRNLDSTYNFSDLMKPNAKKDTSKFNYSFNNIKISGGLVKISDLPKNSNHEIKKLQLSLPFFSNLDYYTDVYFTPSFSAVVNGTPFELKGKTKPFDKTMETEIVIKINKIDLAKYLEYVPQKLNFNLNSAVFSADGHFTFMLKDNKKPFLEYSGLLAVDKINLTDTKDSLVLNIPSINVDVRSAEFVSSSISLKSVVIREPLFNIAREKDGKISLQNLLPQNKPSATKDSKEPAPLNFRLDQFRLEQGEILFTDNMFLKPFDQKIDSINLSVTNLNLSQGCIYQLDFVNRSVEKIGLNGNFVFKPLAANGKLIINGLEPKAYAPYFPADLNIELKSGVVDFKTDYDYKDAAGKADFSISNAALTLRNLSIWQKSAKEEIFSNKFSSLAGLNFNSNQNTLSLDTIITNNAKINLKLLADGKINLSALIDSSANTNIKDSVKKVAELPFSYVVKNFKLSNYSVNFENQTTIDNDTLHVKQINLNLTDLSNQKNKKARIKFSADLLPKGHLGANGTLTLDPFSSSLQLNFKDIFLKPAQAYIADKVNIALTGGDLSILGKLDISQNAGKPLKASYSGDIEINDFATINKENADNFLLWKTLQLKTMDFSLDPLKANIKEINVSELYSLFNIYADGTTNLQAVLKKDTSRQIETDKSQLNAVDTQKTADNSDIRIENVTLDNCNINFSDYRFRNVFSANMKNLNGKITGLSSEQNIVADVAVDGKYDATSPITIAGKVNPLAKDLFVDIGLSFKDMDLTQMNPYSQKYLGYAIRKGKLSLDLKYLVKDKKLDSKNNIFINQLTLGEAVKSPDATNLPIKFALALIRDRNGDINLDVPITGSIDDPKFNVGKLLLHVLGNIITKAVTSPFSALGSLFGGGEEQSYLEFDPGNSDINIKALEKLDKISKGLIEREDLNVEILGFADQIKDHDGLKKYFFDRKLKACKLKDLLKRSDKNITIDSVNIKNDEYAKYLKKVYDSETFDKPKNKLGFYKDLPIPEMENLISNSIVVKNDDLKLLASNRALKAKEYLLNVKGVNSSRVFLVESKTIFPEPKKDVLDSRIEFVLKVE